MTRGVSSRRVWIAVLVAGLLVAAILTTVASVGPSTSGSTRDGDTLVASIRSEPASFNPFTAPPSIATDVVTRLLHASLVRIDRRTDLVEPWLAERVIADPNGVTYTLSLRQGLVFSDGTPVSSEDVVSSFAAAADSRGGSYLADVLTIQGKPIQVSAVDAATIVVRFPAPYAPGVRLLADIPILPARLVRKVRELERLWPSTVPAREVIGLGPFVLAQYDPGQRLVFERNPRYWRHDADGRHLPYLDRLVLEVVADQNAELLRLQSGQVDVTTTESRAEDVTVLRRAAAAGRLQLFDLGPALDVNALWFNLAKNGRRSAEMPWIHSNAFRQAVSHAVDRRGLADTVYLGAAEPVYGPITSANRRWYSPTAPTYEFDPARARQLVASIGLVDRDGDGRLEDQRGSAVRFTLITHAGNTVRQRGAAFIRDELARLGIQVDVASLPAGALFERFESGNYDAMYFGLQSASTDPAEQLEFWLSSGRHHLWHPSQKRPALDWERQIDQLMTRHAAASDHTERKHLFDQVQQILGTHSPAIYFAAPRITVAVSSRVRNATPSVMQPQVLWNPDTLRIE